MGNTTITDIPRKGTSQQDRFGLMAYEKGLETFLRNASTPITVALQGEWGSGKTSLMNVLRDNLCGEKNDSGEYFSVWINTWEYSLMRNPNEALLQILIKMASEVVSLSRSKGEEVINAFRKCFIGIGTALIRTAANKAIDGAGDEIEKAFSKEAESGIADLRTKLQNQINDCISKNRGKKGIIFFIDDLDRIDPPVAVELLELLKNIFTLEHCLFILAIDYDVVIKGLKPKFGELNERNEREFRSFFDKIIQVPFSMPVSQYSTEKYLIEELKNIEVLGSEDSNDKDLTNKLNRAENLTVGHNPRSIKRFLNTLSLIKCISSARQEIEKSNKSGQEKDEDDNVRKLNILLNLSIVGIQVAYPKVYQLLCLESGFTLWDDKIASKMGIPRIDEQTQNRLAGFEEFDETWEQVLYRLCLTDKYLQNNAINISRLLNMIRNEIKEVEPDIDNPENQNKQASVENAIDGQKEANTIRKYMQYQMSQASITNYAAGDSETLAYDAAQLMRDVQSRLLEHVRSIWKNKKFNTPTVRKYNGGVRSEGKYDLQIVQYTPENHKISFHFHIRSKQIPQDDCPQFMPATKPERYVHDDIKKLKDNDGISLLFSDFFKECEVIEPDENYTLWAERCIHPHGKLWFNLFFDITLNNRDAFLEDNNMRIMQDVTRIFYRIIFELDKL